jgi:nucleotide-binding universal stress UspA family protein
VAIREILVHVNVSKHCRVRLAVSAALAKTFDAKLTGLFTSAIGDIPFFMVEEIETESEPTMKAWWLMMRDKVKHEFDAFMRDTGISADWIEVDEGIGKAVPNHAHYTDLTIVGQLDPDELLPRPEYEIPQLVALESGRPALVIPYAGTFATVGQRVLIAWNDSAQSTRAVKDAMPFLRGAETVTILTLGQDKPRGDRIVAYLARHGITATAQHLTCDDISVGNLLLSRASDEGSDLIVMGAYGHSRARESILGGATRVMFKEMTVPVLMSH